MDFVVVEAEGLPDVDGARRAFDLDEHLGDDAVARVLFHHHQERRDRHPFLDAPLRTIAAATLIRCRDDEIGIESFSIDDLAEAKLLEAVGAHWAPRGESGVFWDGGRTLSVWLGIRALVHGTSLSLSNGRSLEQRLGLGERGPSRSDLARRLDIPCEELPSDEENWRDFISGSIDGIVRRCRLNATATARLFLRHRLVAGELTSEDYEFCDRQLASKDVISGNGGLK